MHASARVLNFCRMYNSLILQGLNDAQCEAVMHGEGPAMVVAGPGSGKTLTIIRRLLYLIYECNVPADKILVITYTKEAALSMQQKFYEQKELFFNGHVHQGYVNFGTFHSFFYQIIKNIKKYSEYQLITPQEKIKLTRSILKEIQEEVSDFEVKSFLEQVSFFKNTGKFKVEEDISNTLQKYMEAMHKYKRMDFDDMLYLCKQEFQAEKILLQTWRERYEYILIDEYQDINPIQYDLMYLLTQNNPNLFVVGDDDQAVYGFRGSDVECFQKFYQDYKDTKTIYLNINYRCTAQITEVSQKLISCNKKRLAKNIISGVDNSKGDIKIIGSETTREMYHNIIEKLQKLTPEELNNRAILFRTNATLQSFANQLVGKQIHFVVREKIQSLYEHFIVCDILDFFEASNGCRDRVLFLRLCDRLKLPFGRTLFMEEQVDLEVLKERVSNSIYYERKEIEQIDILMQHLHRISKMRPALAINYILYAMNYQNYLYSKAGNHTMMPEEWQEVLNWLKEDAEGYEDYKSWRPHIQRSKEEVDKQMTKKKQNKLGIHLMTMHATKGLEYEQVYVLPLNDGIIPKIKRGEKVTDEHLEEERRLLYVALTRAKTNIELHYITGTKENPRLKSRFFDNMDIF